MTAAQSDTQASGRNVMRQNPCVRRGLPVVLLITVILALPLALSIQQYARARDNLAAFQGATGCSGAVASASIGDCHEESGRILRVTEPRGQRGDPRLQVQVSDDLTREFYVLRGTEQALALQPGAVVTMQVWRDQGVIVKTERGSTKTVSHPEIQMNSSTAQLVSLVLIMLSIDVFVLYLCWSINRMLQRRRETGSILNLPPKQA